MVSASISQTTSCGSGPADSITSPSGDATSEPPTPVGAVRDEETLDEAVKALTGA
jgi:hypothetical protein